MENYIVDSGWELNPWLQRSHIYIGDSHIDQEHASSAGMRFIAFKNATLDADYHVTSFMEIPKLVIL